MLKKMKNIRDKNQCSNLHFLIISSPKLLIKNFLIKSLILGWRIYSDKGVPFQVIFDSILLKSDLYFYWCIEDLITPHYCSCSNELCICILRHEFKQSDSMFQMKCSILKNDESHFVVTFSYHLYSELKVKTSEISGSQIEVMIWLVDIISTEHN